MYPVFGRVRFPDGKPLGLGRVVVRLDGVRSATGWLRDDGTFQLGTETATDGLPAGRHKVAIHNAATSPLPGVWMNGN